MSSSYAQSGNVLADKNLSVPESTSKKVLKKKRQAAVSNSVPANDGKHWPRSLP